MLPGAPMDDAPVAVDGQPTWLLRQVAAGEFTLLVFGDTPVTLPDDLPVPVGLRRVQRPGSAAAANDLVDTERTNTAPLLARSITPGKFLVDQCCGEINSADVTARGAAFCEAAYRQYLRVYDAIPEIARCEVSYAAPDTWETYDAVAPVIQEAYEVFRHGGN